MSNQERSLREASVQEIQMELIRRTRFNAFDGERVAASLARHRDLWQAVLLDRFCFSNPGKLPAMGLIKLRDLPYDVWNADTLYMLAPNEQAARRIAEIMEEEGWCGEVYVHADREDVERALGSGPEERAVVRVWWD